MADSLDTEKVGEVRFNPYSYTYDGYSERVEEYLSAGEPKFGKVVGAPSNDRGSPKIAVIEDERTKLNRTKNDLVHRGICEGEIVDG